ncbi:50S ribosomal protein L10 [Candidatus Portiera aleyrodidarum]|uniref:Large ribosomal subunit protein uL10 n=1 Tax=Candidatus Portiera aleyrodidarum TaxID=91844 RepID=A0A8D9NB33_9GAMM|nr:50S ribosomal protein L10 [Candidatus Portiera aleyrodidarum]CEI58711.1 50S ribosomal protein L10 [Candidatus Portiera aleyrodidarum]
MKKNLKKKEIIVKKINKNIRESRSLIIVNYKNINSNIMNELHIKGKKLYVNLYVIRNKLFIKAIKGTKYEFLKSYINGQLMIFYSKKNLKNSVDLWNKTKLKEEKIKVIVYNGKVVEKNKIKVIANMPKKKIIFFNIVNMLKLITIGKLIYILMFLINKKNICSYKKEL